MNHRRFCAFLGILWLALAVSAQTPDPAKLPWQFGHFDKVTQVRWSPDERAVASYSSGDNSLRLWDATSGQLLWSVDTAAVLWTKEAGLPPGLGLVAWNADGSLLASADLNGAVQVWDVKTGALRWAKPGVAGRPGAIAFSANGKSLASAVATEKNGASVQIWNVADGSAAREIKDGGVEIMALAWDADGKTLRGGRVNGETAQWDAASGTPASATAVKPCGDKGDAAKVGFNREVSFVAAFCGADKLVVAETRTGRHVREWSEGVDANAELLFSGDGQVLLAKSADSTLYTPGDGKTRRLNTNNPVFITLGFDIAELSRTGKLMVNGDANGRLRITDVGGGGTTVRFLEGHPGIIHGLAFSPDGKKLASGSGDGIVRLWDASAGTLLAAWAGHENAVQGVAFSPDGKTLVSFDGDDLRVWDTTKAVTLRVLSSNAGSAAEASEVESLRSALFSPDGKTLLTYDDRVARLWDTATWKERNALNAGKDDEVATCAGEAVLSAQFSPDGKQIVTGCGDKSAKIWMAADGKLVRSVTLESSDPRAVFSPDGKRLAVAFQDETPVTFYDTATGKKTSALGEGANFISALTYTQDGKLLLTANAAGNIGFWDAGSGAVIRNFESGAGNNSVLAFTADGKLVALGGENQNILLWDTESGKLLWSAIKLPDDDPRQ